MTRLTWTTALETGIDSIDKEHKKLLLITNELIQALETGNAPAGIQDAIQKLRSYTVAHFANEEAFMRKVHYPGLRAHLAEHRYLADKVKDYQARLYREVAIPPGEFKCFLKDWLISHVLRCDMGLKSFLEGRALPPGEDSCGVPLSPERRADCLEEDDEPVVWAEEVVAAGNDPVTNMHARPSRTVEGPAPRTLSLDIRPPEEMDINLREP